MDSGKGFAITGPMHTMAKTGAEINTIDIDWYAPHGKGGEEGSVHLELQPEAGLGKVLLKPHKKNMEEQFEQLSPWVPKLYVHQRDIICKGFIDYFEQRERGRFPRVAASGTTLSYRDMCRSVFVMQNKRPHLLPSAMLWKNQSAGGDPHELRQWWQPQGPELVLSHNSYKWPA
ncbi:LOW QUALITY PROTEIN: hypothetical protein SETIT_2G337100v2 [Setaria italica]|uniref:Uncharacterized protein n=2 Tax=Setaria italica TaxID=4555 RepID=A0A368Q5N2_SETIT|nr:LOW QUALITY PROTEIN: hypothetical protein SETIT_2G337100v2 [Setaria italica]